MKNSGIFQFWQNSAPQILAILRIVAAIIFVLAGSMKLFAFPAGIPPNGGTAVFMSQVWIGGFLEVAGGILLALGLFTHITAFILSGEMAVAYFQFHFPASPWPTINMGIPAILYCFLWLYYSAAGGGAWSLDALFNKRKLKTN